MISSPHTTLGWRSRYETGGELWAAVSHNVSSHRALDLGFNIESRFKDRRDPRAAVKRALGHEGGFTDRVREVFLQFREEPKQL